MNTKVSDNDLINIKNVLTSYIDISPEEWDDYAANFRYKSVKRKEIILHQGDCVRNVYFVDKGLLRIFFYDNNNEEKTFHFSLENTFATDYEGFLKKLPSNYTIQAMEDSNLIIMPYDMLHEGYLKLKNGERLGRLMAEKYFFLFSERVRAIHGNSPLERYNRLNKDFPGILNRVSQHYLASYLNISSVHLSRLINAK